MPVELSYLWLAFQRLRRRKGSNGYSPLPIEWPDIDAFLRHNNKRLAPWELEIVEMLDDLFLAEHANRSNSDEADQ